METYEALWEKLGKKGQRKNFCLRDLKKDRKVFLFHYSKKLFGNDVSYG